MKFGLLASLALLGTSLAAASVSGSCDSLTNAAASGGTFAAGDSIRVSIVIDETFSDDFLAEGEHPEIHYWGGATSSDWAATPAMVRDADNENFWYYDVPSDTKNFLIRDSGHEAQTVDLPIAANSINENSLGFNYADDMVDPHLYLTKNGDGSYSAFANLDRSYSFNSKMVRYWVYRGAGTTSGKYFFAYEGSDGASVYVPASGYVEAKTNGEYFAYFDLDYEEVLGKEYRLVATDDWVSSLWYQTEKAVFEKGDNNLIHQRVYSPEDALHHVEDLVPTAGSLKAEFVGKHVLPAYFTCLNSDVNGYMAYPELYSRFVHNDEGDWLISGNLGDYEIEDYAYVSGTEDYDDFYLGEKGETLTVNVWEKLTEMGRLYDLKVVADSPSMALFFAQPENVAAFTAGALVIVSLLGFSIFLIFRRRKEA